MVRIIVGTLLEVGSGKREAYEIQEILAKQDRSCWENGTRSWSLFMESILSKDNFFLSLHFSK